MVFIVLTNRINQNTIPIITQKYHNNKLAKWRKPSKNHFMKLLMSVLYFLFVSYCSAERVWYLF